MNNSLPDDTYEGVMADQDAPYLAVIPGRALIDPRLSAFQFRTLALMCGYANRNTRICWPKQETLARLLGTNVQVISKIVAKLIKFGYVEITKTGFPARNVYRIVWADPQEKPLAECLPATELSPQTSQSCLPRQVRVVSPDKCNNRLLEQTIRTSSSEVSLLPTSLAQRADSAPPTMTASPERRTRERFDSSALRRDPLYIALAEHLPEPATYDEWRTWAAMIGRLHRIQVSAADIPTAVKGYRLLYPHAVMTIRALVNQWAYIREGKNHEQVRATIRHQKRDAEEAERAAERARREPDERAEIERIERELFGD